MAEEPDEMGEWRAFTSVERSMSNRMTRAAAVPIATSWVQADVGAALGLVKERKGGDTPISFTTLILAAVGRGLARHPELAAQVDYEEKRLRLPETVNVGVAVASDRGLIVPVVRDVVDTPFEELAARLKDVIEQARGGSKDKELFTGGHFTVTNIALGGSEGGSPIMNLPQIAILGVGSAREAPVVVDGEVRVSKLSQLTVALDHRILDGITVAHFLTAVRDSLQDPSSLLDP
jgi:pyruvate/2-oxoglutarate dehydrogenase complex dihydrolipoamide acyltransferase (E2) component